MSRVDLSCSRPLRELCQGNCGAVGRRFQGELCPQGQLSEERDWKWLGLGQSREFVHEKQVESQVQGEEVGRLLGERVFKRFTSDLPLMGEEAVAAGRFGFGRFCCSMGET